MDECDGIWSSKITYLKKSGNPVPNPMEEPDGTITVDRHNTPAFNGRHVKNGVTTQLSRTDCALTPFGRPHIRFSRVIGGGLEIAYEGHVILDTLIVGYFEEKKGGPTEGDTGTWAATREVGPFKDKDKDDKRNRQS
jgi:hypothetical protein